MYVVVIVLEKTTVPPALLLYSVKGSLHCKTDKAALYSYEENLCFSESPRTAKSNAVISVKFLERTHLSSLCFFCTGTKLKKIDVINQTKV